MPAAMTEDIRDLAAFGYRQELDRTLGSFSSFAAGFSYISILTGVFQMFYLGYAAGAGLLLDLAGRSSWASSAWRSASPSWPPTIRSPAASTSGRSGSAGAGLGWMAGWVYLACSVISLAAVALALQATLPQIAPAFQVIGDGAIAADRARNAVLLGCVLIGLTTVINAVGVRLLARINNVGVFAELLGVALLIVLLRARARRGPEILFQTQGRGDGAAARLPRSRSWPPR